MSTSHGPRKRLPENPSEENLRKQAKRLAAQEDLQLAAAQRRLAIEYGYRNWADLMRAVVSRFVPLIPLRELVAFPLEVYPVYVGRPKSISAIDAVAAGSPILLVAQRDATLGEPSVRDMYEVGTLGVIVERQTLPDGTAKIVVEGRKRARVKRFLFDNAFYKAEVEEVADTERLNFTISAPGVVRPASARREHVGGLVRLVLSALNDYALRKRKTGPAAVIQWGRDIEDPSVLPYVIARHLNIDLAQQQALLECVSPVERLEKILGFLEAAKAI
jgi:ATP-dependent Lon protease